MSGPYEREFVRALTAEGYGAVRIPSSGSATDRDLPDVLFGYPVPDHDHHVGRPASFAAAVEHKSGSDTTLYVEKAEVESLTRFADSFGAQPMLAARFTTRATGKAHYCIPPEKARMTERGNYGLPLEGIEDRASMSFEP